MTSTPQTGKSNRNSKICFSVTRKITPDGKERKIRKEGKFREERKEEGRNKMINMWVKLKGC